MPPEVVLEQEIETPEPSLRETIEQVVDAQMPGGETPPEGHVGEVKPPVDSQKPTVQAEGQQGLQKPQPPAPPQELKAPAQWKPGAREKWNTIPREVQEEVLRREADSMRLIGSVGNKIRMADGIAEHLQPFIPRLQQGNIPVEAFIGDVFTTVRTLSGGSPVDKANALANIIQSYGIDIRLLDDVLSHRLSEAPEVLEARRATAYAQAVIDQNRTAVQGQAAERAGSVVSEFAADPKHEFIEDVRFMMADLLDSGQCKTLDDAYAAATWANPDIRKILLRREAEERVKSKSQVANAARRASQAVGGAPRMGTGELPPNLGEGSLRDTIAAAMDHHDSL